MRFSNSRSVAALFAIVSLGLSACGPKPGAAPSVTAETVPSDDEAPALTGTFTVDGKTYTGKVSTQKFPATGQFSVVCQQDDYGFVQITFANEDDARKAQSVKLVKLAATRANDAGTANVSLSPFSGGELGSKDESNGTATVTVESGRNVVTFENAELGSHTGDAKKAVSGKVSY